LSELWDEKEDGWVEAVLRNPPQYSAPTWTTARYPFLVPGHDFVSAFLLEHPDQDLMRECEHRIY